MLTQIIYTIVIALTAIERLIEVRLSNRNAAWSFSQGGIEIGKEHFPFMVVLHTGFLIGCVAEAWLIPRSISWLWIGIFIPLTIGCQLFRWWCINTLGQQWNTRVILVPGFKRVNAGPYQYFSHPNYLIVAVEGIVLSLFHQAYYSAIVFTVLNAGLMWVRIRTEEKALQEFLITQKEAKETT